MKRRQFLQSIPAIAPIINLQPATPNPQPVIISTWDFGKKANNVSWTTLQQGGSALDAVEKGINLIEEDPDNLTVGIGGLPDREGHVTLDACIMDQDSRCGSVMG
ncbi:MAG: isoaspartyl peptidase/L-asparaginase, partial [Sphingobacteriales bacterium]